MSFFVFIGHDGPKGQERRNPHRKEHIEHLDRLDGEGRLTFAGPIRNDEDTHSIGAVIIIEDKDLESARQTFMRDPFVKADVFESWSVSPFKKAYPSGA